MMSWPVGCVRIFTTAGTILIIVLAELATNVSKSVTNLCELLMPEIIRRYLPHHTVHRARGVLQRGVVRESRMRLR